MPSHPVAAFGVAFASHFVLDAIPHKDYELRSIQKSKDNRLQFVQAVDLTYRFVMDVLTVSADALAGIALSFMFFFNPAEPWLFLVGAIGGILPDFVKFLYILSKNKALKYFDHLHYNVIHSKRVFSVPQQVGVLIQYVTVSILILGVEVVKYMIS
ncbi:MAG: hypothetical protein WCO10_03655 [bacterium]